ncbi:MAG: J domain-containing protein [Myxococcales bacterium]|nr:J domain-containing protein [Myxococcales bacterium]MCB9577147.1 J domain-containing protein [Polyangiaceae bacterium]
MRLPGRLGATTLGDLLGTLHRDRATGVLELVEAGREHRIHLVGGLISQIETPLSVARLGELMRREGLVGDGALRWLARALIASPGKRAGELLVAAQAVSPDLVAAALRRQLRLKLDALFAVSDAALRFRVAFRKGAELRVPLSPHEFLHGRPRARDGRRQRSAPVRPDRGRVRALSVLGLGPQARPEDVQRAFRKLARDVHPDRHPRASEAQKAELLKRFAEISAAYHQLVA